MLKEQFFPDLIKRGVTTIINCGDIFDNRVNIGVKAIDAYRKSFEKLCIENGIKVHHILGNHDCLYSVTNKVNSPNLIFDKDLMDVSIYSEPTEINVGGIDMLFIPWINSENADKSLDMINNSKAKYVFGHFEVEGFKYGGALSKGLSPNMFSRFDLVGIGHFHIRQKKGNIYYLGNIMPLDYGEVDNDCGYHILDTETKELEFIPNETYRHFLKIHYHEGMKMPKGLEGKTVRLIHGIKESETDFEKFVKAMQNEKPYDLTLIDETRATMRDHINESVEHEVSTKDIPEIIVDYVDRLKDDIPEEYKEDIKDLLLGAYKKALSC